MAVSEPNREAESPPPPPPPEEEEVAGDGGDSIGEASPDSLKNTPSNIARLEDVIEHCTARRKYLAQTRSPSDGGDVRWYFCKVPLADQELAASVPRAEMVGKGEYFRFGMRDSLAVEASFLQREEELLFHWWKEYAECSEGPFGRPGTSNNSDTRNQPTPSYDVEEERVGVPVKGGLYEVDLVRRHCFPVYWNGENRRVLRGHWFARKGGLDWLPLREDVAEQLEVAYRNQVWHRRRFQPSGLFAARVDLQGSTPGLHALFVGEDDTWEAWLHVDPSGFSNIIPMGGSGVKLRRGYSNSDSPKPTQDELRQQKEEERDDYCSQVPVRHLVFMVHGIGQRLEKSNLVDDVGNFLHITESLAEQHLTSHQRGAQRVVYIPCQWRKGLKLGGESAVENITLDGVRGLRVMLSATVHDVLFYMSPVYCQDIINSVSNQLNRLYLKFLKRNPGYDGKVSIYGHSLGSVLSYDILCHQVNQSSLYPLACMPKKDEREQSSTVDNTQSSTSDHNREKSATIDNTQSSLSDHEREKSATIDNTQSSTSDHSGEISATIDNPQSSTSDFSNELADEKSSKIAVENPQCSTSDSSNELGDEKSSQIAVGNALSSTSDSFNEVGDEKSSSLDGVEGTLNSNDDDLSNAQPSFQTSMVGASEENSDNDSTILSHDSADSGSTENVPGETETLDETTANHCGAGVNEFGKVEEECEQTIDTDKTVDLLRKEIESLKAKLVKLESQHVGGDESVQLQEENEDVLASAAKDSTSEKLSPEQDKSSKSYTPYIKYTKLEFEVDTFFAVGSPLGVFLALRNVRIGIGKGQDYWAENKVAEEMPACRQMLNIFHPFDPVAYRIEPLVCKEYIGKRPVIMPYHKGGKRLHIGYQELTEKFAARSQALKDHLRTIQVKVLTVCESRKEDTKDDEDESEKEEERTYGSLMMERLTGKMDGRIDHVLQDETFRHAYLSAIGSHTNYWRDYDTALFILKHLYQDIPEDPSSLEESNEGNSKDDRGSTGWSDRREAADEELPLTFADKRMARNFSSKVRKFLRKQ